METRRESMRNVRKLHRNTELWGNVHNNGSIRIENYGEM